MLSINALIPQHHMLYTVINHYLKIDHSFCAGGIANFIKKNNNNKRRVNRKLYFTNNRPLRIDRVKKYIAQRHRITTGKMI